VHVRECDVCFERKRSYHILKKSCVYISSYALTLFSFMIILFLGSCMQDKIMVSCMKGSIVLFYSS
jgi:hypothetical protein